MSAIGGKQHEDTLTDAIVDLERKGWRVIRLNGKSPDAIAVRDDRIVAVEVLARYERTRKKKGHSWEISGGTFQLKIQDYAMFDDVIFYTFRRSKWKPPMSDDTGAPSLQMETSDTDARRE